MIRILVNRPIAVLTSFVVLLIFGFLALFKIPVSLLPEVDVPRIVVRVSYQNTSGAVIEENVVGRLRESLTTLQNLENIESISSNHSAHIYLTFRYGTRMDLTFIDVNEKIDQATNILPKDLVRPQIVRINTSDIPIVRIQVQPKSTQDYLSVSQFTEKVIRKRIEQISGVSLVDINGINRPVISVAPIAEKLRALGLDESEIFKSIEGANKGLGSLAVKDGQYRYFVKLTNQLGTVEEVSEIPIKGKGGAVMRVSDVAVVQQESEEKNGLHFFNGVEGLVITVHKQASSRMNDLMPEIRYAVESFNKEYPSINFSLTQDQTYVLDAAISNLYQDIVYGGILCVLLLFMFLGNYASPILMSISIPASVIISFIFFYLFGISFNIISLSGLALGVGMVIDNSIVVLDNITRQRKNGLSLEDSCDIGVREVITPVVSQVLTTVAVYAPLIYLGGLAGLLVYDQAIALTISLVVSLLIAFCLNPVLYFIFLKASPETLQRDTRFYNWVSRKYHTMISAIFKKKRKYFLITVAIMPVGLLIGYLIPLSLLPPIELNETLVTIDWNQPVSIDENSRRTKQLVQQIAPSIVSWESDIGIKQFLLTQDHNTVQKSEIYYRCLSSSEKRDAERKVNAWLKSHYVDADWVIQDAPNAFTQLFKDDVPFLEARFRTLKTGAENNFRDMHKILSSLGTKAWKYDRAFVKEKDIELKLDYGKLAIYRVDPIDLEEKLNRIFGNYKISEIKRFGEAKPILLKKGAQDFRDKLSEEVRSTNGHFYPLNTFIEWHHGEEDRFITADRLGVYKSVIFSEDSNVNYDRLKTRMINAAADSGYSVSFAGGLQRNSDLFKEIMVVFTISIVLLYFILAVQFENLIHPLLVMFTMPLGIAGAMALLYLTGSSLDIMAAIGFIVVLGIIVDDPILKVETINRLRKEYAGTASTKEVLEKSIHEAGEICLKPMLMTSLTTSLALIPILFTGGIGSDLQKPLVYVIVGGLTVGTFLTLWLVPLAYWFVTNKNEE